MSSKSETLFEQGANLVQRRKFENASTVLKEVVELNPEDPYGWLWYGYSFLYQSEYEKAEKIFTKAIELELEIPAVYFHRGLSKQLQNNYE